MLFLFLIGAVSARVAAVAPRSELEHVIIADCKSPSGFESSQYAYYSGPVDGTPDITTNVRVGKQQPWFGKGLIKATFADNTTFSCNFPVSVSEGQFIGNGFRGSVEDYDRGWSSLSCYARFRAALYSNEDGSVCNAIYDCDHSTPPVSKPVSSPGPLSASSALTPLTTTTTPPTPTKTKTTAAPPAQQTNNQDADVNGNFRGQQEDSPQTTGGSLDNASSPSPSDTPNPSTSDAPSPGPSNVTGSGASDAPDAGASNNPDQVPSPSGLTKEEKIGIGAGVTGGVLALIGVIIAFLAWRHPKKTKDSITNSFSRMSNYFHVTNKIYTSSDGGSSIKVGQV